MAQPYDTRLVNFKQLQTLIYIDHTVGYIVYASDNAVKKTRQVKNSHSHKLNNNYYYH